jgi:ubiquinol-cytochrome c reductase cytochrome c1 subunit
MMQKHWLLEVMMALCFAIPTLALGVDINVQEAHPHLDKVHIDIHDSASLQRGAQLFMNYCAGCHSLKYVRYEGMAKDIGIVDEKNQVLEKLVKDNLIFRDEKITDPILTAMPPLDAAHWFGITPPDLSLVARSRGKDWLYTYLRSFYPDPKQPWGVNNYVFPSVAMPHVLYELQNKLTKEQFDASVRDLVNFLVLMGEPKQRERERLGVWVLLFLGVFLVFAWILKREYWKDIH